MQEKLKYLLKDRNIDRKLIKKFELFYYNNEKLYTYASQSVIDFSKYLTNRYNDSIVFPIRDCLNNPAGIQARLFNGKPKYLNTPMAKGKVLYGFNHTYKNIFKRKCVYVVEGPIDFLLFFQYNLDNVVAMLGSRLTLDQTCLLSAVTNRVILVPDGDAAGREAGKKNYEFLKKSGLECSIFNIPDGLDPDTYLLKFGKGELIKYEEGLLRPIR